MTVTWPSFEIDRSSSLPLHRQVEGWLRAQIANGVLEPGTALPSRKDLSDFFGGMNHLTIRQAVSTLTRDGILFSVQGRGTFVVEQKKKQLRIGLVLPHLDDEFTHAIADGMQEYFDSTSAGNGSPVRTVLFDSRRDAQKEIDNIRQLEDLPLDGAIILPVPFGDMSEQLLRLKVDQFPVVLVGWVSGIQFDTVSSDDYKGAYEATRHLLEKGRKHIAWIGTKNCVVGPYTRTDCRLEGYRDAISDYGLPLDRRLSGAMDMASPVGNFESALIESLDRVLAADSRVDAIVCSNDMQAISCIRELKKRGLSVPRDISVIGFDDIREAIHHIPSLTTVSLPKKALGREAARLILEKIENPLKAQENVTLPVNLIARESA